MKRPIFLVEESPIINAAFDRLNDFKDRQAAKLEEIKAEYESEHKLCWDTVENELIALGKIPDREQSLRYCDGVIFLKDEEEDKKEAIAEFMKKALSSLAD